MPYCQEFVLRYDEGFPKIFHVNGIIANAASCFSFGHIDGVYDIALFMDNTHVSAATATSSFDDQQEANFLAIAILSSLVI